MSGFWIAFTIIIVGGIAMLGLLGAFGAWFGRWEVIDRIDTGPPLPPAYNVLRTFVFKRFAEKYCEDLEDQPNPYTGVLSYSVRRKGE